MSKAVIASICFAGASFGIALLPLLGASDNITDCLSGICMFYAGRCLSAVVYPQ